MRLLFRRFALGGIELTPGIRPAGVLVFYYTFFLQAANDDRFRWLQQAEVIDSMHPCFALELEF